jgi:hypothetical protein
MAREQEKKDLKELIQLEKDYQNLRKGEASIAFNATESLKEVYGIKTKVADLDRSSLKISRQIQESLLGQDKTYSKISEFERDRVKNANLLAKAKQGEIIREKTLSVANVEAVKKRVALVDEFIGREKSVGDIQKELLDVTRRGDEESIQNTALKLRGVQEALEIDKERFFKRLEDLDASAQELLFIKLGNQELEKSNKLRDQAIKKIKPASQFLQILGSIPGFSDIATEAMSDLLNKTQEAISKGETGISQLGSVSSAIANGFKTAVNPITLTIAGITALIRNFNALSEAQTNFVRLTGQTPRRITLINDRYLTGVDLIKTQVELTNQLGINAREVFSLNTLAAAGEFTKTIGLSAETSANLARFSTINNEKLNESADALSRSVPSAFSQAQILEETANVSSDIAVSLGSSTAEIGKAVIEARKLGLSLQQVNDIAGSLLDIESSIATEFEAEVITGKQLNLERARFFALTNDLEGLTKEIANNEEIISSFAGANRIEQEAIAGALGMSRQQMADMVLQSDLLSTLSNEQRANAAGVSIETLKQLDAQQALRDSFAQLTQSFTPIVKGLTDFLNFMLRINEQILIGAAAFKLMQFYQKTMVATAILRKINEKAITFQIMRQAIFQGIGAGFKKGLLGPLLAGGVAALAVTGIKAALRSAGDAVIPAGKGPIISTQEGGLIQGTANDDIIMAPGISNIANRQRERNINSTATISESQMNKLITRLENSVAKGAEKGTSNAQIRMDLDGNALARGFDSYLAVNTRKYNT